MKQSASSANWMSTRQPCEYLRPDGLLGYVNEPCLNEVKTGRSPCPSATNYDGQGVRPASLVAAQPRDKGEISMSEVLFGSTPPEATENECTTVDLGIIGRGHVGKTVLFNCMFFDILQNDLPSLLQLGLDDPLKTAGWIEKLLQMVRTYRQRGEWRTVNPDGFEFNVFEGASKRIRFAFQEVIGQVLTQTTDKSSPEQKQQYNQYIRCLSRADVLWVAIPCPPQERSSNDEARFRLDRSLARSYLQKALEIRQGAQPVSVMLVLTKIDSAVHSPRSARDWLSDDILLKELKPLVDVLKAAEQVSHASIVPVSALGFQKTQILDEKVTETGGLLEEDENTYILKPDAAPEPFNISPLVILSLMCGIYHKKIDLAEQQKMASVFQMLESDFDSLGGWHVPIRP